MDVVRRPEFAIDRQDSDTGTAENAIGGAASAFDDSEDVSRSSRGATRRQDFDDRTAKKPTRRAEDAFGSLANAIRSAEGATGKAGEAADNDGIAAGNAGDATRRACTRFTKP